MKLPKLKDLMDEQMHIYERTPDESLFVVGPPGSGKTMLAVMRARLILQAGQSVQFVTRNRMLTSLAARVCSGHVASFTMHKFVTDHYHARVGGLAPQNPPFVLDWEAIMAHYAAARVTPALDHLIVDEGQNLPPGFFTWALKYAARLVSVFADEDQGTDPLHSSVKDIMAAGMPAPFCLQHNHRNSPEIAAVAEHFHHGATLPAGIVVRKRGNEVPSLVPVQSWNDVVQRVATRRLNRGSCIGLIVRTKESAHDLAAQLAGVGGLGRVDVYTNDVPAGAEAAIDTLAPGITVITSESVIGLEFDDVFLQDLSRSLPCTSATDSRRMYMMCARAKNCLMMLDGPNALAPHQIAALPDATLLTR